MIVKLDQFSEVGILKGLSIFVRSKQQKLLHHHHFFKFAIFIRSFILIWIMSFIIYHRLNVMISPYLLLVNLLIYIYLLFKNPFGGDGSDQLNFLIFMPITIASFIGSQTAYQIALLFIASQSILSYVVAGVSKLFGPLWRNGSALKYILRTKSYGEKYSFLLIDKFFRTSNLICFIILIWECSFFMVIFEKMTFLYLFIGLLFHLFNAYVMGLNNFLLSFVATYFSIIFLVHQNSLSLISNHSPIFEMLFFIFSILFFIGSVIVQFKTRLAETIRSFDRLSVLPSWTFFAPNPMIHDFKIIYLLRNKDELEGPQNWIEIDLKLERKWFHMFWNPHKRFSKCVIDIIQSLMETYKKLDENSILISIPYLSLSTYIEAQIELLQDHSLKEGFQYAVLRNSGYDQHEKEELLFVSAYHCFSKKSLKSF
jgi:hypothetical protein